MALRKEPHIVHSDGRSRFLQPPVPKRTMAWKENWSNLVMLTVCACVQIAATNMYRKEQSI